jgi:3-hydroxyacyl-CoA dehydrogenase
LLNKNAKFLCINSGNLEGLVKKGSLTPDRAKKTISLLKGVLDYSDFKDVDMVIEVIYIFLMLGIALMITMGLPANKHVC